MKIFFTVLLFFILCGIVNAQWVQINGPNSPVYSLVAQETDIYAGTGTKGVFLAKISNPGNWVSINSGLPNLIVVTLGIHNSVLFAGMYTSNNSSPYYYTQGSWASVAMGTDARVKSFFSQDSIFFAGTAFDGVYRSEDGGINWIHVNTGMPGFPSVQCFAFNGSFLFAGTTEGGIYRSSNNGFDWTTANDGLDGNNIYALAAIDSTLLASVPSPGSGNSFRIYRSENNGVNWDQIYSQQAPPISQLVVSGRNIFGVNFKPYLSTDLGTTWNPVDDGLQSVPLNCLAIHGDYIYGGSNNGMVYRRPIIEMITEIRESSTGPTEFELDQNFPNPFNPSTTISFSVPNAEFVNLKVFNALGQEVASLVNEEKPAGIMK
jgi:photosystem II stability/assembly factor-like uncharacterized protein